jgi:hypothetical protein
VSCLQGKKPVSCRKKAGVGLVISRSLLARLGVSRVVFTLGSK